MPDTPSITIVKSIPYKGGREEYSNTYHFSGPTPGNPADWRDFGRAIFDLEAPFLMNSVFLERIYGYAAGNETSVAQLYRADGGVMGAVGLRTAGEWNSGDSAVWVRWKTPNRTSKGRPIYLRKYFHGMPLNGTDAIPATVRTDLENLGAKMIDGSLPGARKLCGPQGAVASTPRVAAFSGYRQLRRTGKRPS